jgi:hypothetical protein
MLWAAFYSVRPEKVDRLRGWMDEIGGRRDEVLASYAQEGTRHELAYLVRGEDGPILVYIAEVENIDRARAAFRESELPIDLEHREVMRGVVAGREEAELLFECVGSGEARQSP